MALPLSTVPYPKLSSVYQTFVIADISSPGTNQTRRPTNGGIVNVPGLHQLKLPPNIDGWPLNSAGLPVDATGTRVFKNAAGSYESANFEYGKDNDGVSYGPDLNTLYGTTIRLDTGKPFTPNLAISKGGFLGSVTNAVSNVAALVKSTAATLTNPILNNQIVSDLTLGAVGITAPLELAAGDSAKTVAAVTVKAVTTDAAVAGAVTAAGSLLNTTTAAVPAASTIGGTVSSTTSGDSGIADALDDSTDVSALGTVDAPYDPSDQIDPLNTNVATAYQDGPVAAVTSGQGAAAPSLTSTLTSILSKVPGGSAVAAIVNSPTSLGLASIPNIVGATGDLWTSLKNILDPSSTGSASATGANGATTATTTSTVTKYAFIAGGIALGGWLLLKIIKK